MTYSKIPLETGKFELKIKRPLLNEEAQQDGLMGGYLRLFTK